MGQSTANTAFVVFVAANLDSVNAELHNTKAQLNKAYDTATYFRQVSQNGHRHLKAALSNVEAAVKQTNKLLVLSKRSKDATAAAAQILATQILQQVQRTTTALEAAAVDAIDGMAAANRIACMQEVVAELETTTIQNQNVRTAANVADSALLKIQPAITVSQHGACLTGVDSRPALVAGNERGTNGKLEWSFTAIGANTAGTASGQPLTICCSTQAEDTPIERAQCGTPETQIGIQGGKVFTTTKLTGHRVTNGDNTEYNELAANDKIPSRKTLNPELKLLRKLEAARAAIEALSMDSNATTLAQAEQLKGVIAKALDEGKGSYSKTETKTKVDAFLKELFGDKEENVKTTIEKDLKELKPPKSAVRGNGEKKLAAIKDPKALANAQIYYTVTGYIADQEEKKNQASPSCPTKTDKTTEPPKKRADECKKHKTAEDCKKKTGCDFDEKKTRNAFPKLILIKKMKNRFLEI
uniref:Variant surface glycoprotein 1125.1692 n=1 Tax=Trypanosoma brucei TaxID=5691 RepID=A0A1J0R7I9_9TRYP|nr:variant surface glycoprotein 1125.1692 [Trypanosoma brucei]